MVNRKTIFRKGAGTSDVDDFRDVTGGDCSQVISAAPQADTFTVDPPTFRVGAGRARLTHPASLCV